MKNSIKEIFGRNYSWSYRLFKIKELFGFLPSYYELTIIPTIVLGCVANLSWYGIRLITEGNGYVTTGEFAFSFIFFFVMITLEDFLKMTVEHFKNDFFR